ncbi:hypothetical protein SAMN04487774_10315 [Enterococcus faecalis]|uniref:hypothetical protein n=1 Tax=Enterococcus TaxID=1350 RepID=UPI00045A062D|nr:hypothetical protein [Enterococcus faecalis]KAJ80417.1 hypothetical protein P788_0871 [Enterococcus faecalis MTUP9]SDN56654.1 hypothetical protein SAMN04487774_10315 [Enterococcus faecalis]
MIVTDVQKLLSGINNVFAYHLPIEYKMDKTFILLTEVYSVRSVAGSNVTTAKTEEVQMTITYDDETEPDEYEDKINELLESNNFVQISGYHQYDPEIAQFQAILKYQKTKYLRKESD